MAVKRGSSVNVEIIGISPFNKGALLMFEAIREQFRQRLPNARFAVPFDWPAEQRYSYGLSCTFPRDRGRFDRSRACELLPSGFRQNVGLFAPSDVDVVLDASGFGYGDYWGLEKLQRRLVAVANRWKTERRTLVLLPQALGPFHKPGMAQAFRKVLDKADLVFVRDKVSLGYVEEVGAPLDKVRSSPDFTNLLHAELPARLAPVRGAIMLIPNEKMVGGDGDRRRSYLAFLELAVRKLSATGRKVMLLVHEGIGDRALARDLNGVLSEPIDILDEPSPLVTKAVIGAAHATVSSRFHGLISAVSSGVPSVACGWTHKYGEVMADYGCPELDMNLSERETWGDKLDLLIASAQQDALRQRLRRAANVQCDRSEDMWRAVFGLLHSRHGGATAHHR